MPARPSRVYLHVGLPKTGTTRIQALLWRNRDAAARGGLLYPGGVPTAHFHAAVDLQRERYPDWAADPGTVGAWDRLVARVRAWHGTSVISHELLATATREQAATALSTVSFAEVHIVCTVRDLARQLPSVWQENIKTFQSMGYREFLEAVRTGEPRWMHDLFWGYQDVPRVLDTWGRDLPPERVHVVTLPPSGAPEELLWQRFAGLLGADPGRLDRTVPFGNQSLGMAEAELLRRLNMTLAGEIDWVRYGTVVKDQLAEDILSGRRGGARIALPVDSHTWVRARAADIVDSIDTAGYDVVGDLTELLPTARPAEPAADTSDAHVLDVAVDTLAQLVLRTPEALPHNNTAQRVKRTLREQQRRMLALGHRYRNRER